MRARDQAPDARKEVRPEYLTAEEVATLLQASPKTVYRIAKLDPTMPMLKLGGLVRFPRERLERWLRAREQGRPLMQRQVRLVTKSARSAAAAVLCADPCAEGRGDRPA
jgi:excisionase family DNA binding protein